MKVEPIVCIVCLKIKKIIYINENTYFCRELKDDSLRKKFRSLAQKLREIILKQKVAILSGIPVIYSSTNAVIRKLIYSFYTVINHYILHMPLPIHTRYESVFLSNHGKGPQLSHVDVAKTVHCSTSTVIFWLNRWMQSRDLTDSIRSDRPRATTQKQD